MLDAPFAAFAKDAYAVEDTLSPPCVNAVHRPNAAGPVASGPTGVDVGVAVGVDVGVSVGSAESVAPGTGAPIESWAACWIDVGRRSAYAATAVPPTTAARPARSPIATLPPRVAKTERM